MELVHDTYFKKAVNLYDVSDLCPAIIKYMKFLQFKISKIMAHINQYIALKIEKLLEK